jgi:hypothetical protein
LVSSQQFGVFDEGGLVVKRFLVGVSVLIVAVIVSAQSKAPIQGVWRVAETVGGRGAATPTATNVKPQPGFYIFTASHYSVTRVLGDTPRMAPKDANNPTLAELTDANRFVGQFGTYELKGDAIMLHPSIARNPATMNAAALVTGTFKLEGNTLTVTTKDATGQVAVVKMARVE